MSAASFVSLVWAAAFALGCAALWAGHLDTERVGAALAVTAASLTLALLFALTPRSITIDPHLLDPFMVWPQRR